MVKIVSDDKGIVPIQKKTLAKSLAMLCPDHVVIRNDIRMQFRKGSAKELCC